MKPSLFLAAIFLAPVVALAQSTEPMKTKALSFNINGLNLSGLNGGVGGKLWLSDNRALVGSLSGGISHYVRESSDSIDLDDEYSTSTFAVIIGLEQHFPWTSGLSPFLTGGLSVGRYETIQRGGSVGDPSRSAESDLMVGAYAGFGLEYWLTPRISLAGQQLLSAGYRFGKYEPDFGTDRDTRRYDVSLGTSSLILSVYL